MTMVSRNPFQIVAFDVDKGTKPSIVQRMVDEAPRAEKYCTDGAGVYLDVEFFGHHIRNLHNKNDTYAVEGMNSALRHYIAGLRRKSRCFFRSFETLKAVIFIFANAYNKFGEAKRQYKLRHPNRGRHTLFHHLDFI